VRHVIRPLAIASVLLAAALGAAGPAAAQPPATPQTPAQPPTAPQAGAQPPATPHPVATTECSPVNAAGYQLCSTDQGTVRLVPTPGVQPFTRLDLTFVRELRHNGAVAYRGEEQHLELDTKPGAQDVVRAGAVIVGGGVTCTYDDSSTVTGNTVHRQLSNLACTPDVNAAPTTTTTTTAPAAGTGSASAGAAAKPAKPSPSPSPSPSPLPTYNDYSAVDTAPNGLTTPIRYGTDGMGSTQTGSCTSAGADFQSKIDSAAAGAVICVQPGDYSGSTMTINKAITVRATHVGSTDTPNATAKVKNIVITGSNATVDGFDVVGGTLGNPNYAIKFSGTGHKIINNLVRGRGIWYAIGCEQSAGCGSNVLISGNTITGVHNFGIYLWGGDHITVEKNNIFDLYQSTDVDDVDAMRAWGTNHVVRNNYIHDINGIKSVGSPHSDCYQAYQAGSKPARLSSNILYENNYCVRVTGQCMIVQNDQRKSAELHDYTLRGNVCETYGWQSIEFDAVPNITMDNDYVAGVQVTVLNFANPGTAGLPLSTFKVHNTVLVRSTSGSRFIDGTPADNTANRTLVDTTIQGSHDGFITPANYPPVKPTDFNKFYRDSVGRVVAPPPPPTVPAIIDAGSPPNSPAPATDVDGGPRVKGLAIDIGPFEFR
jgi:parallel beta-helix repeat protein